MAHSPRIAKLHEECIPYIERCGWKYIGRNFGSYWFKGMDGRKTMSGSETISFTLTELRHAFNNGW
jgi:hypothetical protein